MKVQDVITPKHKHVIEDLIKQVNNHPTEGEIVWKSLQIYFAKLAGRVK